MKTQRRPMERRTPSYQTETTVCAVTGPKILGWLQDLDHAKQRVLSNQPDEEAIHDLRVAMRRIRSLLRLVRSVYGAFHVDRIRGEMKRVADATSELRDEEVLEETLEALRLEQDTRKNLREWMVERRNTEAVLRQSVVRLLQSGALEQPMRQLEALVTLPCHPNKDREARKFARRIVERAQSKVERARQVRVDDVEGMHQLRIYYKRLRYAVEAFSPVLPPELRAWGDVAAKFQKVLGNLHDHDVALQVIDTADGLDETTRERVLEALRHKRHKLAQKYIDLVGPAFLDVQPETSPHGGDAAANAPDELAALEEDDEAHRETNSHETTSLAVSPKTEAKEPSDETTAPRAPRTRSKSSSRKTATSATTRRRRSSSSSPSRTRGSSKQSARKSRA